MLETNKLLETQCEDLLRELLGILKEKWPLVNRTGETYVKSIFNCFIDLYSNDESSESTKELKYEQLQSINECDRMFEKLNDLLKTFQSYVDRINKIKSNLVYIIDLDLEVHKVINKSEFKNLINEISEAFQKELHVKSDLISQLIREARFSSESQTALMACWIHEAFISYDVYLFKLKNILETIKQ